MEQLNRLVLDAINDIEEIKRANGQAPSSATLEEIMNSLRPMVLETLRNLYRNGLITFHKTVNGIQLFGIARND